MPPESTTHEQQPAVVNEARRSSYLWVCFLLVLATALRLVGLGSKSFWLDESASSLLARADWHTFTTALVHRQTNMALYYVLLRGWMHFGDTEMWLRLLSVVFGVAAIPLMYLVAANICGIRTGRMAALLLSIHVFHIQYSQEARGYSLVVFLTLISCCYFSQLLASTSKTVLSIYILSSILMVYAHIFGSLILLTQWMFGFLTPTEAIQKKRLGLAVLLISFAVTPLFVCLLFFSDRSQLSWMGTNSIPAFYEFLVDLNGRGGLLLIILFAALLLASLRFHRHADISSPAKEKSLYLFLWMWLLLPIIVAGAVSLRTPVLQSRYLILCLPPFLILAAHGLASLSSRLIFISTALALAALLLIAANSYYQIRMNPSRTDNWREATHFLLSHSQSGDTVVFPYSAEEIPFRDYVQRLGGGNLKIVAFPQKSDFQLLTEAGTWSSPDLADKAVLEHRRVWVVSALQPNSHSAAIMNEIQTKLARESRTDFGFVMVRFFEPLTESGR